MTKIPREVRIGQFYSYRDVYSAALKQARDLGLESTDDSDLDSDKKPAALERVLSWVRQRVPGSIRARPVSDTEAEAEQVYGWRIVVKVDDTNRSMISLFMNMYPEVSRRYFFFEEHDGSVHVRHDDKLIDTI